MSNSLETLSYAQAQSNDKLEECAQQAMQQMQGFPETISPENQAHLYIGYIRRYAERHPAVTYAIIDGNYVQASPEMISNKKVEKVSIDVHYAKSFSTHEYGRMSTENPALRKVIQTLREDANTYCSNRLGDLKRAARKILKSQEEGVKRETKTFQESVKSAFDGLEKSVKTKAARGDTTASPDKFKAAMLAFWKAYKA